MKFHLAPLQLDCLFSEELIHESLSSFICTNQKFVGLKVLTKTHQGNY